MRNLLTLVVSLAVVHLSILTYLHIFRSKIKEKDVVGVVFGDFTINRIVVRVSKDSVFVKNLTSSNLVEVQKTRVYVADKNEPADELLDIDLLE
jgi:hypothetical protein